MATLTKANKFSYVSLKRHFDGAYSSGSVQDFHLIPFSTLFPNGKNITKIGGKGTKYYSIKEKISDFVCFKIPPANVKHYGK